MQHWHRSRLDATLKTVAHDKVSATAQALDERVELLEVVGIVGITHDDEAASSSGDAALQSRAIPFFGDWHDTCPKGRSNMLGTVRAAIVCDQHFARYS